VGENDYRFVRMVELLGQPMLEVGVMLLHSPRVLIHFVAGLIMTPGEAD
jgi:hypothetical protein